MNDQLTQCPHCQTSFRVTPSQLKAAGGLVRCGSCLGLFSAAINFIRVKPGQDEDSPQDSAAFDDADSDDILLGDLDLDDQPLAEEATEEAAAGDILFADPATMRAPPPDDYEVYEEYEEAPDLLANLGTPAPEVDSSTQLTDPIQAAADDLFWQGDDTAPAALADSDAYADEDPLTQAPDSPSEEFEPRTILFDDDDDEEDDDFGFEPDADTGSPIADDSDYRRQDADDELSDELPDEPEAGLTTQLEDEPDADLADAWDAGLDLAPDYAEEPGAEDLPAFSNARHDAIAALHTGDEPEPAPLRDELADMISALEEAEQAEAGLQHEGLDDDEPDYVWDAEEPDTAPDEDNSAPADAYEEYEDALYEDEELEADAAAILAEYGASTGANTGSRPAARRQQALSPEKAALHDYLATLEDEDELEPLELDPLDELEEEPVLLAADRDKRSLLATTGLLLLCLLLIGALLLQFVDRHLEALRQRSSFARFEPWFCAVLDCPPPAAPVTASSSLYAQELLIRTHPRLPGALELSFIFRNDAAAAQPFPGLELSFRDAGNRLLANRLLLPADYLPPELRPLQAMPARSSVQVNLELLDPGAEAVNYTIAFRDL